MNVPSGTFSKKRKYVDVSDTSHDKMYSREEVDKMINSLIRTYESRLSSQSMVIAELRNRFDCKSSCKQPTYIS